ncbi:hypothetical protein NKG94_27540 [Micromonospora sp. M12]
MSLVNAARPSPGPGTTPPPSRRVASLLRRLIAPERLYIGALGLTGLAAVLSVALPPAERGELSANMVSATLGAAVGGLSLDTFLLSRPGGWVFSRGRSWILAMLGPRSCSPSSPPSYSPRWPGSAVTWSVWVRRRSDDLQHGVVDRTAAEALHGGLLAPRGERAVLVGGYVALYFAGHLDGGLWSMVWLVVQWVSALAVCGLVLGMLRRIGRAPRPEATMVDYRADLAAVGNLHLGIFAQMMTLRFNQILVARFVGAGPLGVYALAVAALEFAQAGAVVRAQRILASRDGNDAPTPPEPLSPRRCRSPWQPSSGSVCWATSNPSTGTPGSSVLSSCPAHWLPQQARAGAPCC